MYSHLAWQQNIEQNFGVKIPFPVIADLNTKVSRLYGMIPENAEVTTTVRTVFFIDDKGMVRALIYYPLSLGRNIDEIVRVVDGLQINLKKSIATPADWWPGDEAIIPAPTTADGMRERVRVSEESAGHQKAWYYRTTPTEK